MTGASSKVAPAGVAVSQVKKTTVEHKTIIDGVCYDITKFMDTHPGEENILTTFWVSSVCVFVPRRCVRVLLVCPRPLQCSQLRVVTSPLRCASQSTRLTHTRDQQHTRDKRQTNNEKEMGALIRARVCWVRACVCDRSDSIRFREFKNT